MERYECYCRDHPRTLWHEDQSKEVECYVEEIKNILLAKNFVYDITESISIT